MNLLSRTFDRFFPRTARDPRRGTVLIFALGVLAVVSVLAVGYVTVVRIDRGSSAAVARSVNYQQQVNTVADYIGALLTADLFGNKLVNTTIPRESWPGAFEDGDYSDYPTIDQPAQPFGIPPYSFNTAPTGQEPSLNSILEYDDDVGAAGSVSDRFEVAPADDAWLASTEPIWSTWPPSGSSLAATNDADWLLWPQITNLRSVYTYDTRESSQIRQHRWVRMDGRYADLGEFFESSSRIGPRGRLGDAGVDILRRDVEPDSREALGASAGSLFIDWVPPHGQTTGVYHLQMSNLDTLSDSDPQVFTRADERYWADTDGDLRPDARWTELDVLGNLFGLRWVVAARIIDASALANINTALEQGFPDDPPTGRTPADVDLFRILDGFNGNFYPAYASSSENTYAGRRQTNVLPQAFAAHIEDGIGYDFFFRNVLAGVEPRIPSPRMDDLPFVYDNIPTGEWQSAINSPHLTSLERAAIYEFATVAPGNPIFSQAGSYPLRDMIDLFAFHGTNDDRVLSVFEQFADGPADQGFNYLPDGSGNFANVGPLYSRMPANESRTFASDNARDNQKPTIVEMKSSARRLLTAVSGVGPISPVPVISKHPDFAGTFRNEKINFRDFKPFRDVPRTFESMMWALAPLSSEQPLWLDRSNNWIDFGDILGDEQNFTYGGDGGPFWSSFGGATGAAQLVLDEIDAIAGLTEPANARNAYPTLVAASLATNLADAIDEDDEPTISRFFVGSLAYEDPETKYIELGTRTSFGDLVAGTIDPLYNTAFPGGYFGTALTEPPPGIAETPPSPGYSIGSGEHADKGMTFVGLDRQPYIREVFTAAWYSDTPVDGVGNADGFIQNGEALGSTVAVQLFNPWPDALQIEENRWFLVIPESEADPGVADAPIGIQSGNARVFALSANPIPPNGSVVFRFITAQEDNPDFNILETFTPSPAWTTDGTDGMLEAVVDAYDNLTVGKARLIPRFEVDTPVAFGTVANGRRPALLMYRTETPGSGVTEEFMMVDRVQPDTGQLFPAGINTDFNIREPQFAASAANYTNVALPNGIWPLDSDYFSGAMEYDANDWTNIIMPDLRNGAAVATGRVMAASSLTRPSVIPQNDGFPSVTMAFNATQAGDPNLNTANVHFGATVWIAEPTSGTIIDTTRYMNSAAGVGNAQALQGEPKSAVRPPSAVVGGVDIDLAEPDQLFWELDNTDPGVKEVDNEIQPNNLPPYQLYVPNEPLGSVADIGMVSIHAHTCRNHDLDNMNAWTLASERLARSLNFDFMNSPALPAGPAQWNMHLGVLDTSRYVPGADLMEDATKPYRQQQRIPLALRAFDCFEALPRRVGADGRSDLIQGVVNANTAPAEVLAALPFVAPLQTIQSASGQMLTPVTSGIETPEDFPLVHRIRGYRDVFTVSGLLGIPYPSKDTGDLRQVSGMPGLRIVRPNDEFLNRTVRGFVSLGELALLHDFDQATPNLPWAQTEPGIQQIGLDTTDLNAGAPFELWDQDAPGRTGPGGQNPAYAATNYNPRNDYEERMAIFRALSNITTTRSDVFIAWFIVRGYDPDAIDQIVVPGNTDMGIAQAMDDPLFRPTFEQRYLAVFDRSNVKLPIDRPQLLMLVQLPPTSP